MFGANVREIVSAEPFIAAKEKLVLEKWLKENAMISP